MAVFSHFTLAYADTNYYTAWDVESCIRIGWFYDFYFHQAKKYLRTEEIRQLRGCKRVNGKHFYSFEIKNRFAFYSHDCVNLREILFRALFKLKH